MVISELALISTTEGCLQRKGIRNAELFPDCDTGGRFLSFLDNEWAITKVENVAILIHERREDPLFESVIDSAWVSIHKDVFLPRVTMQITDQEYVTVLLEFFNHIFHVVDRRLNFLAWFNPTAIQIETRQITPRVTINNAINVEHRDDLKNKVISQDLSIQWWPRQIVQNAFHHPTSACLTWMHSRWNHNAFTLLDLLSIWLERSNDQHIANIACDRLA